MQTSTIAIPQLFAEEVTIRPLPMTNATAESGSVGSLQLCPLQYILFYMNKIPPTPPAPQFFPIFLLLLGMLIDSEIMGGFWHSRFLNNHIYLFYMIGSLASGTNVSLVAKNGTKKITLLLWIKLFKKPPIKTFYKTGP